jgi:hypothetical protein
VGLGADLRQKTHGSGFALYGALIPPAYSFVTALHGEGGILFPGFDGEADSITTEASLVAWSWARLVAPAVASQMKGLSLGDLGMVARRRVMLTSTTPWRALSGPSCGVTSALALLQVLIPGLSCKADQAMTGAMHLSGRVSGVG